MTPEQKILADLWESRKVKPDEPEPINHVPRCQHINVEKAPCYLKATGIASGIPACRYHLKRPRPAPEYYRKLKGTS